MKQMTSLALIVLTLTFLSCNTEQLSSENLENKSTGLDTTTYNNSCFTTDLIAGQHHIAGTVDVSSDGENLIITYTTNADWTINATHISIGNCDDESIPTTGAGNPQIGHFEHSTTHSTGVNEVIYYIPLNSLDNHYCFAAHAEVSGLTDLNSNETAWAAGIGFDGNSWAMYVEAYLTDCNNGAYRIGNN